jgi:hypothetical protein
MRVRRTAAMEWAAFRSLVIHDDTPPSALLELRRVFYAGISSGMQLIGDPEAASLEELADEIDRFIKAEAKAEITGEGWEE